MYDLFTAEKLDKTVTGTGKQVDLFYLDVYLWGYDQFSAEILDVTGTGKQVGK